MDMQTIVFAVLGLALLVGGAELLVRGASRLAATVGVTPLVIGLTVVAYGTSAPELAISINASFSGQADIAAGNIVGSNIFNVLLVLGLSAMIAPLVVSQRLVRMDVPLMIAVSIAMLVLGLDGNISRIEGLVLFAGVLSYTVWSIRQSRRETKEVRDEYEHRYGRGKGRRGEVATDLLLMGGGITLLIFGSEWLVDGAAALARFMGVGELIIGLTIVAAGTSLPELATSIVAAFKGERDIAVGNAVGSCIFNILSVLGLSSALNPGGVAISPELLRVDIPVMIAVAVACLPIFFTGHMISRWEGVLFFGYYVAYVLHLILDATSHGAADAFSTVMVFGVIPLTFVTLLIFVVRATKRQGPLADTR